MIIRRNLKFYIRAVLLISLLFCFCCSNIALLKNFEYAAAFSSDPDKFQKSFSYNYNMMEIFLGIYRILTILSYIFLIMSFLLLNLKIIILEKNNYIFMNCIGYSSFQTAMIIFFNNIFIFIFSSFIGVCLSLIFTKLCLVLFQKYLFSNILFVVSYYIFTEIILMVIIILISIFYYLMCRHKPISRLFGGRL